MKKLIEYKTNNTLSNSILNGTFISDINIQKIERVNLEDLMEFYIVYCSEEVIILMVVLNSGDIWAGHPELDFLSEPIKLDTSIEDFMKKYPSLQSVLLS